MTGKQFQQIQLANEVMRGVAAQEEELAADAC